MPFPFPELHNILYCIHETDLNVLCIHWILLSDKSIELCITKEVEKGWWRSFTNCLLIHAFPKHIHGRWLTKIYSYIFVRYVEENHQGIKDESKNSNSNKIDRTQVEYLKQGYCQLVGYYCSNSYFIGVTRKIHRTVLQNTDDHGHITFLLLLLASDSRCPNVVCLVCCLLWSS